MSDYIINVCGDSSNATWLIKGDNGNVLYEAGMAYSAGKMIENIKKELNGDPLHAVILSHSHYDHVAGLPFVRMEWPNAVVYGSEYAAKILEKSSVRETMKRLSSDAAKGAGMELPPYEDSLIKIDRTVKEGDIIRLGDTKIRVFETPGHTKCSVSYLVNDDVLMASETIGVFKGEWYMPCYLVGYQMSLDAVEKLRMLGAKRLFVSHRGISPDEDMDKVWEFLKRKLEETKQEIIEIIQTYETREEQMMAMKVRYHDNVVSESEQPSFAFLLNAAATLNIIEKECMEEIR